MKSNFLRLISVVAAVLTVVVFLSGYSSIWQVNIDPDKTPLLKTVLTNDGWVNIVIYLGVVFAITVYIDKTKRRKLFLIINENKDNWHKQKHIQSIAREIKHIDKRASLNEGGVNFIFTLVGLLFIYNSSVLTSISVDINLDSFDEFVQGESLEVNESKPRRIEIHINGSTSRGSGGITNLVSKLSPVPLDDAKEYIYKTDNGIGLYLPSDPVFIIESGWWFVLYIFLFISPFYIALENYNKYLFLVRVKKMAPKTLEAKKIEILSESISKYSFQNSGIKALSAKLIWLMQKRSNNPLHKDKITR